VSLPEQIRRQQDVLVLHLRNGGRALCKGVLRGVRGVVLVSAPKRVLTVEKLWGDHEVDVASLKELTA